MWLLVQPTCLECLREHPGVVSRRWRINVGLNVSNLDFGRDSFCFNHVPNVDGHIRADKPVLLRIGVVPEIIRNYLG